MYPLTHVVACESVLYLVDETFVHNHGVLTSNGPDYQVSSVPRVACLSGGLLAPRFPYHDAHLEDGLRWKC